MESERPPVSKAHAIVPLASHAARAPVAFDLVCFSHLRWNYVYQRPQHLLTRAARGHRVFVVEEPWLADAAPHLAVREVVPRLHIVVPHLPKGVGPDEIAWMQAALIDDFLWAQRMRDAVFWYYTPMALAFTRHLTPRAVVYDCMDELSAFAGAPPLMRQYEDELFARADLVFTGGQSLYEAKRGRHPRVFAFPSSVDAAHFARARAITGDPPDQAAIPHPRLGFFGVIDERMDLALLAGIAAARPDWHLVMIGPVTKIDEATLPRRANIHYLGMKAYAELPAYLAGWDVALLPFAINASTRFISPTKTPEYLAAGVPVVSTPVRDVVRPYGEAGIVHIADRTDAFVAAVARAMQEDGAIRLARIDAMLAQMSWGRTWTAMEQQIVAVLASKETTATGAAVTD